MDIVNKDVNNDNFGFSVITKEEFNAHADALCGILSKLSDGQLEKNTIPSNKGDYNLLSEE